MQSVVAGMALSVAGMLLATAGELPPIAGAIFQEVIDVAVVLNALRALGGGDITAAAGTLPEEAERPWPQRGRGEIVEAERKL